MILRKKIIIISSIILVAFFGIIFHTQVIRGAKILADIVVPPNIHLAVGVYRQGPNPNELIAAPGVTVRITGPENPPTQTQITSANGGAAFFPVYPG